MLHAAICVDVELVCKRQDPLVCTNGLSDGRSWISRSQGLDQLEIAGLSTSSNRIKHNKKAISYLHCDLPWLCHGTCRYVGGCEWAVENTQTQTTHVKHGLTVHPSSPH